MIEKLKDSIILKDGCPTGVKPNNDQIVAEINEIIDELNDLKNDLQEAKKELNKLMGEYGDEK